MKTPDHQVRDEPPFDVSSTPESVSPFVQSGHPFAIDNIFEDLFFWISDISTNLRQILACEV